jgi:hypothetical protein
MSSLFVMGDAERAAVRAAIKRARKKPIPWAVLSQHITANQDTDTVMLSDRRGPPVKREPEQVMLPFGHRLAVTFEEQPSGLCAHLSLSSGVPGRLPDPLAMAMVIKVAGLEHAPRRCWIEEFLIDDEPSGRAINVIAVVEPAIPDPGRMQ